MIMYLLDKSALISLILPFCGVGCDAYSWKDTNEKALAIERGRLSELKAIFVGHQATGGVILIESCGKEHVAHAGIREPQLLCLPNDGKLDQQSLEIMSNFPVYRVCDMMYDRASSFTAQFMPGSECYVVGTDPFILAFRRLDRKAEDAERTRGSDDNSSGSFSGLVPQSTGPVTRFILRDVDLAAKVDRLAVFPRWTRMTSGIRYDEGEYVGREIQVVHLSAAVTIRELLFAPSFDEMIKISTQKEEKINVGELK